MLAVMKYCAVEVAVRVTFMEYRRMMPFLSSSGGGSQVTVRVVALKASKAKFSGGPLGSAKI